MNIKFLKVNKLSKVLIIFMSLISINLLYAQAPRVSINLKHGAHQLGKRTDQSMETWRNYGLGQFIHWGVYAIPGGQWNNKKYRGAAEWIRSWDGMPKDAYDNLYKQFNPKGFNAKAWAKQAKHMGAKYVILTTKHHDGFCLWPSKFTDYTIINTPYKKDIIGQLVDAYNEQNIDVYLYFSIIDWNHPGYRSVLKTEEDRKAYETFKVFTENQLTELLNAYPTTKGLWFDGTWDSAWKEQAAFADSLDSKLRKMIPGLVIGARFRPDEYGKRGFDSNGDIIGDYEQGWERKMPNHIDDVHGNDWECVMTVPENQWGYQSNWEGHIKTSNELIEMIAKAVSLDGNFVLNFGPDGQGVIRSEETQLAKEIGDWMEVNNEAIYNGSYLNWEKQDWGYYTKSRKTNKIYMIVCNVPVSGMLRVKTTDKIDVIKASLIQEPTQGVDVEIIGKNEYFIHLKSFDFKKPFVLELETKLIQEGTEIH
ncbi:alpha-L-fucosidase [Pseudalgibacter alginicilyticus]|uniref:alpha-L-fucosidase n=1 Tax=Pseudalgibacter alginicilyticus TaxID=1736674 RepID=A0A0P0DD93_9FLAO|nr:alpha-L-fucosidase [Pseudalgibacter alginicilyticus]ALJ06117.1 alpha-L-fucosidase [Pseudalgibacter alginicilyticus]